MTIGTRLKILRQELGLTQQALGDQGLISAPGWIKIENGQRLPSEKFIEKLIKWLIDEKRLRAGEANKLREELITLKYFGSLSPFIREMARVHARTLPNGEALLTPDPTDKPKRGRPRRTPAAGMALVAETPGIYKVWRRRRSGSKK